MGKMSQIVSSGSNKSKECQINLKVPIKTGLFVDFLVFKIYVLSTHSYT